MVISPLNALSADAAAAAIISGDTTSVALVESCLDRIESRDALVSAWVYVDAELALSKAREADAALEAGQAVGPLHGVPVAIRVVGEADGSFDSILVFDGGRQSVQRPASTGDGKSDVVVHFDDEERRLFSSSSSSLG